MNIKAIKGTLEIKNNVRKIVIFTNVTIVPNAKQIEVLKNIKVLFVITDYGCLSKYNLFNKKY